MTAAKAADACWPDLSRPGRFESHPNRTTSRRGRLHEYTQHTEREKLAENFLMKRIRNGEEIMQKNINGEMVVSFSFFETLEDFGTNREKRTTTALFLFLLLKI